MNSAEKLLKLTEKLAEKKTKESDIKSEYVGKKLTTAERIERIERLLGIEV